MVSFSGIGADTLGCSGLGGGAGGEPGWSLVGKRKKLRGIEEKIRKTTSTKVQNEWGMVEIFFGVFGTAPCADVSATFQM